MITNTDKNIKVMLTVSQVLEHFNISPTALWNWTHDKELNFPKPIKIRGRRYFLAEEIERFQMRLREQQNGSLSEQEESTA
ncbi:helix-turn-helix transcriptional regulator [Bartonella sp. B17]